MDSPNLMAKICSEMARRSYNRYVSQKGPATLHSPAAVAAVAGHVTSSSEAATRHASNSNNNSSDHAKNDVPATCEDTTSRVAKSDGHVTSNADGATVEGGNKVGVVTPQRCDKMKVLSEVVGDDKKRRGGVSHFSATLGIDVVELPRRKLRSCTNHASQESLEGKGEVRPSSPVVLSAALGITQLEGTLRRRREAGGLRRGMARRRLKEAAGQPSTEQKNKSSAVAKTSEKVDLENAELNPPPKSSAHPPHNPPHDPTHDPPPLQGCKACPARHKSPWRWASMRKRLNNYTPAKKKGAVSK